MILLSSGTGLSRLVFEPGEFGMRFRLEVAHGSAWHSVSAPSSLVSGTHFDLTPETVIEEGHSLRVAGERSLADGASLSWTGRVSAVPDTDWFSFEIEVDSDGFELGTDGPAEPEIVIKLGSLPPYERGNHVWFKTLVENPPRWNHEARGNGFPATYYFDPYLHAEFFMFFDMTPMTWMSTDTIARFREYSAGMRRTSDGVLAAELGLLASGMSGHRFPAGRQLFTWSLAVAHRSDVPASPTEQDALVRLVDKCLPLTRRAPNRWPAGSTTWTDFAEGAASDLMDSEHSWRRSEGSEHLLPYVDGRSDAWVEALNARGLTFGGSGPSLDAALWILRPLDAAQRAVPNPRWDALQSRLEAFVRRWLLDPASGMLTGRASELTEVGSWQYVYLIADAWSIYADRGDQELCALLREQIDSVMIPLAHSTQYVFPLGFDKSTLRKLGPGNNVGVCGTYALLMVDLARRLGSGDYLNEARRALRVLANVPIDDALQEVFLTAHALAAADELFALTGEPEWVGLRDYFRAQTIRMMYWFDDRSSPITAGVDHLGMFEACLSINYPAFFENLEVDARLASALPGEQDPSGLLAVLDNGRRSNFSFFPECSPEVFGAMPLPFIPFEELPLLDGTANAGFLGQEIYGAGWTFRAYLLWEAYVSSSDREVMVVNVDSYREPTSGPWAGSFFIYNGTEVDRTTNLSIPVLRAGERARLLVSRSSEPGTELTVTSGDSLAFEIPARSWSTLAVSVIE